MLLLLAAKNVEPCLAGPVDELGSTPTQALCLVNDNQREETSVISSLSEPLTIPIQRKHKHEQQTNTHPRTHLLGPFRLYAHPRSDKACDRRQNYARFSLSKRSQDTLDGEIIFPAVPYCAVLCCAR